MDIYGNKRQPATIPLTSFVKEDYTDTQLQQKLTKTGDTMSGALNMGMNRIIGLLDPSSTQDVSSKTYTDNIGVLSVAKTGDTMSGSINMNLNKITNLGDSVSTHDIVTKTMQLM